MAERDLVAIAKVLLKKEWVEILSVAEAGPLADLASPIDSAVIEAIMRCINSKTKSYRYVLPTQLVAKVADSSLDCRCIQSSRGGSGAFDARTIAHAVIVPFDRENENVLGGSPEPYVNNPLRIPEKSSAHGSAQKDKLGWKDVCHVLNWVEGTASEEVTLNILRQVLIAIHNRLATVRVAYPVPQRISLNDTLNLVLGFLRKRSGGDRLESVVAAILSVLGERLRLFDCVRRGSVTTADASSGMLGDIECVDSQSTVVYVVEAKDRELTIRLIQDKIPGLRQSGVTEAFFVATQGVAGVDETAINEFIAREFSSGQNLYIFQLEAFMQVILAVFGEPGRRQFLAEIGKRLDEYSDISHRRDWAEALRLI